MSDLKANPTDIVNKSFAAGIDLKPGDKADVPSNREKEDPTPAEDSNVALSNTKVDPGMANSSDQSNNSGKV